jgi:hypothetical protein
MEIRLLHSFAVRAERRLPLYRQILILRHDVLDRIFVYRHPLFAAMIFQSAQPIAAAAKVVEISGL